MNLTASHVRAVTKRGLHGDGGGLYLSVAPGGSKSWIFRATVHGKRKNYGLGGYPGVSLGDARRKAGRYREAIANGRDPRHERQKPPTFREAAKAVFDMKTGKWRNGKHTKSWWQSLERHAFPVLGDMPMDKIDRTDVLRCLDPIWTTRLETARRVRQRIRTVLRWGMGRGFLEINPAGEAIDGALEPMRRLVNGHMRALPYEAVPDFVRRLRAGRAAASSKLCLEFLILTAARSGEARGARWGEIDMDARLWTVPAGRMKANEEHRVPLSGAAMAVLRKAEGIADGSDFVFPTHYRDGGKPLSDQVLMKTVRRLGDGAETTVHGFRSSFRDFAGERTDSPHAVMELCLAHRVGSDVERAYARSSLLDKRRALMETWAAFVTGTED